MTATTEAAGGRPAWRALLDGFEQRFPVLNRLTLTEPEREVGLDLPLRFVLGVGLDALKGTSPLHVILLPEPGPITLLAGVAATLTSIQAQAAEPAAPPEPLHVNDMVVLRSRALGREVVARYLGTWTDEKGRSFHRLGLRGRTNPARYLQVKGAYTLVRAPLEDQRLARRGERLSTSHDFQHWCEEQDRESRLALLLDADLDPASWKPAVLLVAERRRLEHYLGNFRLADADLAALLGVRHVFPSGESDKTNTLPLVWHCGDLTTARECLQGELGDELTFPGTSILIDGAFLTANRFQEIRDLSRMDSVRTVVFAGFHERENVAALRKLDATVWPIRPRRMQANTNKTACASTGVVSTFQTRLLTPPAEPLVRVIRDEPLRRLASLISGLRSQDPEEDGVVFPIVIYGADLLRRIVRLVLRPDRGLREELRARARQLSALCSSAVNAVPKIGDLMHAAEELAADDYGFSSRELALKGVLAGLGDLHDVVILCPTAISARRATEAARADLRLREATWMSPSDFRLLEREPRTVVVSGWLGREAMREFREQPRAQAQHYVVYGFEHDWIETSKRAGRRWERNHCREYESALGLIEEPLANDEEKGALDINPEDSFDGTLAPVDAGDEPRDLFAWIDARLAERAARYNAPSTSSAELVQARLIRFNDPFVHYFAPLRGKLLCVTSLLHGSKPLSSAHALETNLYREVEQLTPGDALVFSDDRQRDIFDTLVDGLLLNAPQVRKCANLWRDAIETFLKAHPTSGFQALQRRLHEHGVHRHIVTLRQWLLYREIVAPRGYESDIPKIGAALDDLELKGRAREVIGSIDTIYRARREALLLIAKHVEQGGFDAERSTITVSVGALTIPLRVLEVESVSAVAHVPRSWVGRLRRDRDYVPDGGTNDDHGA